MGALRTCCVQRSRPSLSVLASCGPTNRLETQHPRARPATPDVSRRIVERSTTGAEWVDEVETGWTQPHVGDWRGCQRQKQSPCQGEGRGFESRLPLQCGHRLPLHMGLTPFGRHHCPSVAHHESGCRQAAPVDSIKGSIRGRGSGSFEMRVYAGTDPNWERRRCVTRTVRGDRVDSLRELKVLAVHAKTARAVRARTTIAVLLDQWLARSRIGWSPTTVRDLGSITERHLKDQGWVTSW